MRDGLYVILAFYTIERITDPHQEIARWKAFLTNMDVKGRIYINGDGVNAQMSVFKKDLKDVYTWIQESFPKIDIKIHYGDEHPFFKMTVKYRQELATMGKDFDFSKTGEVVSTGQWAEMLKSRDENTIVLDVRNDYEWDVGHFEGAEKPQSGIFKDFPAKAQALVDTYDVSNTKIMMYCTGGIRCSLYSCLLKEKGFEHVYQLDGGVIKYGLEQGTQNWKGNLFVFDNRLVVSIDQQTASPAISRCSQCEELVDVYYNCANMDCNQLFLSCKECSDELLGCCSEECKKAPRCRDYVSTNTPKPFKKLTHSEKEMITH